MPDFSFKKSTSNFYTPEVKESFNNYYRKLFGEDIKIERFDKNEIAQRSFGTDVVITKSNGVRFSIDEKTRSEKYYRHPFYPFETWSNYELKHRGWIYTTQANYISYGTIDGDMDHPGTKVLELLFFPLSKAFKFWFEKNKSKLKEVIASTDNLYHSHNRLVHINDIKKYAGDSNLYQISFEELNIFSNPSDNLYCAQSIQLFSDFLYLILEDPKLYFAFRRYIGCDETPNSKKVSISSFM